jgi:hypothetical protein
MAITIDSSAQQIVIDLRRSVLLKKIGLDVNFPKETTRQYQHLINKVSERDLAEGHVYDLSYLFDPGHTSYVTSPIGELLFQESKNLLESNIGLFTPHDRTLLIGRWHTAPGAIQVSILLQSADTIIVHMFFRYFNESEWCWVCANDIQRYQSTNAIKGFSPYKADSEFLKSLLPTTFAVLALINRKGDAVVVDPAPWELADEPAKPKSFEIRNPSVSVVHVNTPRLLRPAADDDGSSGTVRPHDRRAHLRRRGRKIIQVRASKIHGGAPSPTAKVVKLDEPLP